MGQKNCWEIEKLLAFAYSLSSFSMQSYKGIINNQALFLKNWGG
jgi:hypothetical protein